MGDIIEARFKAYIVDSNKAVELKLVRDVQDITDESTSFYPNMSHQVFGDSETIFGYRDLKVKLYYSAGCLETYAGLEYAEKLKESNDQNVKPDDVLRLLTSVLSTRIHNNLDTFISSLVKDDTFVPAGNLVHAFSVQDDKNTRQFEVYKADISDKNFEEYHTRLQTFVLWYIDAANFIDIDDDQWHYFIMFEKYVSTSGPVRYAAVGLATLYQYYAYPHQTRPRIAQILILPPFQNIGLGANLLRAIYIYYIGRPEVKDITVEGPSANFQRLRDYIDAVNCCTLPSFQKDSLLQGFSKTMVSEAREHFKINKIQARRIYEILRLRVTNLSNGTEYRNYRLDVKRRLNVPFQKEECAYKKLEPALNTLVKESLLTKKKDHIEILEKEYRLLEEEYAKIIKRMENSAD